MNETPQKHDAHTPRGRGHLAEAGIEIWREAMEHLRHLSNDVWKMFALSVVSNLLLVTAISLIPAKLAGNNCFERWAFFVILGLFGVFLTLTGRYLFKRHRVYYLQMLAKKTLLEIHLGFYEECVGTSSLDLAFPWRITPEVATQIATDPEGWVKKSIGARGTTARVQFWVYDGFLLVYAVLLLLACLTAFA